MGPLAGLRVLELAAIGPVPFCGMLLGDMGAEVVRIDRVAASELGIEFPVRFDLRSRNKRSLAIDLKRPEGVAAFMRLIEQADVLLEGFRPGVMERLGIGPEACLARRPPLVYGRATGWGREGLLAGEAGHDINFIAVTGVLDMIGEQGGGPVPPLNLVGDYAGEALYLAFGVACAVLDARASGTGQVVDAAMVDGTASLLTVFHGLRQMGELLAGRGTNLMDGGAPHYGTYRTSDGLYVAVGAVEARFYANLLAGLDLDPASLPAREDRSRLPELRAKIGARFLTRTRDAWARHFAGRDACVTPVLSLAEAGSHPHNAERRMLLGVDGVEHTQPSPRFSRTPGAVCRTAPLRGEHTIEVLRAFGFEAAEITAGLEAGVFAASSRRLRREVAIEAASTIWLSHSSAWRTR